MKLKDASLSLVSACRQLSGISEMARKLSLFSVMSQWIKTFKFLTSSSHVAFAGLLHRFNGIMTLE